MTLRASLIITDWLSAQRLLNAVSRRAILVSEGCQKTFTRTRRV